MLQPIAGLVLVAVLLAVPASGATVQLQFVAPPRFEAAVRSLQRMAPKRLATAQLLVGLEDAGPPIRVFLAPEGSPPSRGVPEWVAGYALIDRGIVVLFPERSISYPDESLDEVLVHEVTHVLTYRAARGQPVPRWFDEGLAMAAASAWSLGDRSRLSLALLGREDLSLARVSGLFTAGRGQVPRAYAISGAAVQEILQHHGEDATRQMLERLAHGDSFSDAFQAVTGTLLAAFEDAFWGRYTFWYRWLPVLTSSATLWLGILLLAFWAYHRRRARRVELEERWEREDEEASNLPHSDQEPVN